MPNDALQGILNQVDRLTADQKVSLAAQLAGRVHGTAPARPRRKWRDIRGMARPSLLDGEDAQQWVSRTRREADERRFDPV